MNIEALCQPLAMRPPNGVCAASSGSVWKGCGSKRRPNSSTSSVVTVMVPSSWTSPVRKSSK